MSQPNITHTPASTAPAWIHTVFRLAAVLTGLAVMMGSVVCATESGAACPTWPGCYPNQLVPVLQLPPLVEFTHRLVAILAGPAVLVAAVVSRQLTGHHRAVRVLPWVALAGAVAAGVFGRAVVLTGLPKWLGVIDLCAALLAMAAMTTASRLLDRRETAWRRSRVGTMAGAGFALLLVTHMTGIVVAGQSSYTRCVGWPLRVLTDSDLQPWLQVVRVVLALAALGCIALVVSSALARPRTRTVAGVLGGLVVAELLLGVVIRAAGLDAGRAAAYSVIAVLVLWTLAWLSSDSDLRNSEPDSAAPSEQRESLPTG